MSAPPRIGLSVTAAFLRGSAVEVREVLTAAHDAGLDYVQIGDHVSFIDGTGFDGLVYAAAALSAQDNLPVQVGLYLLALRHPVLVARQLADIAGMAPGRLTLGVGVGGEDRREFLACGVDPATRGRRTDESMDLLRELLTGRPVSAHGEFFDLDQVAVTPAPAGPIKFIVGGRSDAALRRAGRRGDGWLALWASPQRYAEAVATIADEALAAGRGAVDWDHGLNLWCGLDTPAGSGRDMLAAAMEERYKVPFGRFAKWCPSGTADDVAAFVVPYVGAGCRHVTIVLHHPDLLAAVAGAAAIRDRVRATYLEGAA